ncbi:hypothetical protein WICPIJ_003390 [Wickerhamomyces pijperi]|uniref:Uncharacterized protein n=1 Tax=Wickerhamomyces pijperi TaxID=599730 RepID=A0A9P8Q7G1_WICPI|nr:hypothetical protein WICPIJ_003390 [Wickerhamomyces pijperi]
MIFTNTGVFTWVELGTTLSVKNLTGLNWFVFSNFGTQTTTSRVSHVGSGTSNLLGSSTNLDGLKVELWGCLAP